MACEDITERKQAEEELRDSEGRFKTLFEKSTEAQLLLDHEGKVVNCNKAFVDLFALQDETESIGHSPGDFAPEFQPDGTPSRERGRELLKTVLERGSVRYEWAHLKHDASRTPVLTVVMCTLLSISGQPMIHVTIRDITARKRAEEALQESEDKFRLSFESANTGMCLVDISGNLMRVNEKMRAIFGYTKQELESMTVNNIAVPEDANLSPEFINKASAGEMDSAVFEKRYYHKDGHIVWGLVSSSLVRDTNGRPSYFISQVQDITERKQAEAELQKSEEQARQLAQENAIMAEIGRIVSSTLNISEVYERFAQQVQKLISFDRININLIDHEARTATPAYSSGKGVKGRRIGDAFPLEGTAADEVIRTHSGLLLHPQDEAELERRFLGLVPSFQAGHRSMMVVPLVSKGKVIASLYFGSTQPKSFAERHLKLAENIGAQIAGAIANAQLYNEWKRTEEALRESEERFRDLYDSAPVGYHACDAEGRITNVNQTELEMLGYSPQEMIGQDSWKLNVEEDLARQRILEKLAGLRPPDRSSERTYRRKDGTIFPVLVEDRLKKDENGRITGIRCTIQDFTDRKRAEEGLLRSEEKAKQLAQENAIMAEIGKIISSTPNIDEVYDRFAGEARKLIPFDRINIAIINLEEKTATAAYGTGSVVSGRQPGDVFPLAGTALEEIMRTHSGLLVQSDNASHLVERFPGLLTHFQAGQRSMLGIPLISKDRVIGGLFLGSARLNAYTNRDLKLAESIGSQIAGAIANAQLFSERQRLEERLRRAEKMEALGTLAGGVAHDLNNVLGVLVGYSELLLMEIREGSPLRRHVSNILQSSQRAAAIIQDLLTLARRGVAVSEVVNLNPVISDYFKTPEFERLKAYHPRVTFRTDLDKDLMNIKGSPIHLTKTIMNLLSNAAEAISDRGEVTLVTENRYLDKPITGYDHIQEGDYVVMRVSDNGKGISGGDIGKIFEPFYTKKVMGRSGTGLGLAVVWGTMKDHHGYIDVESEEGKGSVFTLYFPVTREESVSDQKVVSPESYMGRGESILVVDDVKEQRELATTMLSSLGYKVNAVSSGEEALTYLKTDKADLLVLDMIMEPGMDGLETYQRVVEISPKQKAIIVSGFSETDRVKRAQELGAGTYVRKPYILEKIGLAIRRELDK